MVQKNQPPIQPWGVIGAHLLCIFKRCNSWECSVHFFRGPGFTWTDLSDILQWSLAKVCYDFIYQVVEITKFTTILTSLFSYYKLNVRQQMCSDFPLQIHWYSKFEWETDKSMSKVFQIQLWMLSKNTLLSPSKLCHVSNSGGDKDKWW